ncbi:MAG: class I SAM-dependent methyltransferase [Candidatus Omnitrophota bacterium]|nr:class I SAM-dependent methyltransferase [Candidatus Omnitrophota bacterium]
MTEIINTGERILLEKETPLMIARHFCAYRFAKDYVLNKDILDIGCGEGYGSHFLAGFVKKTVGIDYDKEIISYAKNKYQKDNLDFYAIEVKDLSSFSNKFDAICSFQVIEHIPDTKAFLEQIKDLLTEKGIFICSTPNRLDASPHGDTPLNRFHVKEYLINEFKALLGTHFSKVEVFGLKRGKQLNFYRRLKKIGLFNFFPPFVNPVKRFYDRIDCDDFIIVKDKLDTALDFIAVCNK